MNFVEALVKTDCDTSARIFNELGNKKAQLIVYMTMEGLELTIFLSAKDCPPELKDCNVLEMNGVDLAELEISPKQIAHFIAHAMVSSDWEVS